MKALTHALLVFFIGTALSRADIFDLTADWSNDSNPNGVWSYNEGNNPLPHVDDWQSAFPGWGQEGWAESENGNNRLPFWFQSNGAEPFTHDYLAGDIVVHTTDPTNGVGNGLANVTWTSFFSGTADLSGAVWIGRDIGRSNHWRLSINGTVVTEGDISSGDAYSRANPFDLSTGTGGASVLNDVPISSGTVVKLEFDAMGGAGDFVGVDFTVNAVPEPGAVLLLLGGLTAWAVFYRKRLRKV
jgi:hypothetical protein